MSKPKILVVDDSPTDRRVVTSVLQRQGYAVVTAADGDEALEKVTLDIPDLIVLDVVMPKRNGFQVCRQLKTTPATKDIKILLLTSKNQESDRFWGIKQGADGYITKPFADEELLNQVAELL